MYLRFISTNDCQHSSLKDCLMADELIFKMNDTSTSIYTSIY